MTARRCSIEGCANPHLARGWCRTHWQRWYRTGDPGPAVLLRPARHGRCKVPRCRKRGRAQGLCDAHWSRQRRHGDVVVDLPVRHYRHRGTARVPAVALLPFVESYSDLARLLGRSRMSEARWTRVLLTTDQADDVAARLGLHPCEIWGDAWLAVA